MYELLDHIDSPSDIKKLSLKQLEQLCSELRQYIVECCSENPGHLASSLGAVELIVGWHYVYDAPQDKLVFDVGHQAYAHKIITGRRDAFRTLRREGGLSGFPLMKESPFDAFGAGHSSTSISAALGLAEAARIQGRKEMVVALIGDGALSGGLSYEGLNNSGDSKADLLVLLNDNEMSIDSPHGGMHKHLLKLTTSGRYNSFKNKVWHSLGERSLRRSLQTWIKSLKSWLVRDSGGDLFESLGFRYFGPIDGNNIAEVVGSLQRLRNLPGPRVLHCLTTKGKGYAPAEKDPVTWHAPGRFNPATGEREASRGAADRYQDVFGATLCALAEKDTRVVGITPAMALGSGLTEFSARFPERFYDVGIEEEHAVTFSAGLAAGGLRPFCCIYSSFSQRAYDQIIHDVALQGLPVVLCLDRAGLVGEDGATHQGAFDMASLRSVPGTVISSPRNEAELKNLMYTALLQEKGPFVIRYPRGCGEGAEWKDISFGELPVGRAETLLEGDRVALVATGPSVNDAMKAAAAFPGRVGVYNFRYLKPLDTAVLDRIAHAYAHIITIEDGCLTGGLFGAVSEHVAGMGVPVTVEGLGIPDKFIRHATRSSQKAACGTDADSIAKKIQNFLEISK